MGAAKVSLLFLAAPDFFALSEKQNLKLHYKPCVQMIKPRTEAFFQYFK